MLPWLMAAALAAPVHRPAVSDAGEEVPPPSEVLRVLARGDAVSVRLSPHRTLLAIGESEGRVRLWSVERRADHLVLEGLRRAVGQVLWSGDSQLVVGVDRQGIAAWSVEDPAPLWVRPMENATAHLDGVRLLVRAAGEDHALDLRTGLPLADPDGSGDWVSSPDLITTGALRRDPLRPQVLTWSEDEVASPLPPALPAVGWEGLALGDETLAGTTGDGLIALRDPGSGALVGARDLRLSGSLAASGEILATRRRSVLRVDPSSLQVLEVLDADARTTSLAASEVGRWWAVGTQRGPILLVRDGEPRTLSRHRDAVRSLASSPDGRWLASGADGGAAILWDLDAEPPAFAARQGLHSAVTALALSETLWVAGTRDGTLHILGLDGGVLHELEGHAGPVTDAVFTPDGAAVITASGDERVRVWDPWTGTLLHVLEGHEAAVRALAMHPSGAAVYAADRRGSVLRWSLPDGPAVPLDRDLAHSVRSVAWTPDGSRLVSGGGDGGVRLWSAETGSQLAILGTHARQVNAVAVSPDGALVASGAHDHTARLWRIEGGLERALRGATVPVRALDFSPDGEELAASAADGAVRAWSVASGEPTWTRGGFERDVSAVHYAADGRFLLASSWDKTARVFDLATDRATLLVGPWGAIRDAALHPDGHRLATASKDGTVRVWRPDGHHRTFAGHGRAANSVDFSPDGRWLASGGSDGAVRLVDLSTARAGPVLTGHDAPVRGVAWSPDGTRLASVGDDGVLSLWSAPGGHLLWRAVAVADGSWASHGADGRLRGSAWAFGGAGGGVEVVSAGVAISPVDGRSHGRVEVEVRAMGPEAARDVRLAATWVPGLLVEPMAEVPLLEPGATAVLTGRLVSVGAARSVPLQVLTAGAEPVYRDLEVDVALPDLTLVRAGHRPGDQVSITVHNGGEVATGPLDLEIHWVDHRGEVQGTRALEWASIEGTAHLELALPPHARRVSRVRITARSRGWPGHAWTLEGPLRAPVPWGLFLGAAVASTLLLAFGLRRGHSRAARVSS